MCTCGSGARGVGEKVAYVGPRAFAGEAGGYSGGWVGGLDSGLGKDGGVGRRARRLGLGLGRSWTGTRSLGGTGRTPCRFGVRHSWHECHVGSAGG